MKSKYLFQEDKNLGRKVLDKEFLDHFIGFQTRVLYSKVRQQFFYAYADMEISTIMLGIVMVVAAHPGSFQKEIARRVGVPETVAVRSVKELHDRGIIEKKSDPRDRRHYRLNLTTAGEEFVERVLARSVITHDRMLKGIPEADAEAFLRCCVQIGKNIDAYLDNLENK